MKWFEYYEGNNILILTARKIVQLLQHGLLKSNKIGLLIIDEIEKGKGAHDILTIIIEYILHINFVGGSQVKSNDYIADFFEEP